MYFFVHVIVGYNVHGLITEILPTTVYDYKLHRFIGENISLLCEPGFNPDDVKYTWLFNGSELKSDSRHRFYTPHLSHQMLWILHLTENDFGEYSCEIRYKNGRRLINQFIVQRIYEIKKRVVVPIGESLIVYALIKNLQRDARLFYTVDGRPELIITTGFRCARFANVWLSGHHRSIIGMKRVYNDSPTSRFVICPSPDEYGNYRFYIQSQMFYPELNRQESTVVQLPPVYHVVAGKSIKYDNPLFKLSTITSAPLTSSVISEDDIKTQAKAFFIVDSVLFFCILVFFAWVFTYFELNVRSVRMITKILWPSNNNPVYIKDNQSSLYMYLEIFILFVIFFLKIAFPVNSLEYGRKLINHMAVLIFYVYTSDMVIIFSVLFPTKYPNKSSSETPPLCGIPTLCELKQSYDIYLSYTDDDMVFVRDTILPFLEEKKIKVFFRERDILPGQSDLTETEKAICESRAFLVLVTANFVKDSRRNKLELPMIRYLVNMSDKTPSKIVLMLLTPGCSWNRCVFDKYKKIKLKNISVLQKTEVANITCWLNKLK
ncbi:hypothetical protein SNE40_003491 [Patella caerulea]|uniref:Uncharacterized protein n=1 Tax=Patella caerulea TaxID=87958 RepID=A0AAN8K811_PATCE